MNDESTLSIVVLPEPVPPETTMLSRASTQALRNVAISAVNVPNRIRSSTVNGSLENFRIVTVGPFSAIGGMIAFTREPSGKRASTVGDDSSMRRPSGETMRSMTRITCSSSLNSTSVSSSLPLRST